MKLPGKNFWENLILAAIILVVAQTFLDEYSRYALWTVESRNILLLCGLFFDFLFSVEFTVRSIISSRGPGAKRYWLYERGWVDFLSSVPLLVLDSGPSAYFLLAGDAHAGGAAIGVLNVLKVVKAIRITRVLRLIRIIKVFGKIHHAESVMAQHHTAAIATTSVFAVIITMLVFNLLAGDVTGGAVETRRKEYLGKIDAVESIHRETDASRKTVARTLFAEDPFLMKVLYRDDVVVSRVSDVDFTRYYDTDDYIMVEKGSFTAVVTLADLHRETAYTHMMGFFIIVAMVLAFMILYSPHFVQTISDVIHILNQGFRKKDYNLQIKIPEQYRDQEIYRLARFYNDAYLPAKLKQKHKKDQQKKSSSLSMNDLMGFGGKK